MPRGYGANCLCTETSETKGPNKISLFLSCGWSWQCIHPSGVKQTYKGSNRGCLLIGCLLALVGITSLFVSRAGRANVQKPYILISVSGGDPQTHQDQFKAFCLEKWRLLGLRQEFAGEQDSIWRWKGGTNSDRQQFSLLIEGRTTLPFRLYCNLFFARCADNTWQTPVERACCQGGPRDIHSLTPVSESSLSISEVLDPGTSTTAFF